MSPPSYVSLKWQCLQTACCTSLVSDDCILNKKLALLSTFKNICELIVKTINDLSLLKLIFLGKKMISKPFLWYKNNLESFHTSTGQAIYNCSTENMRTFISLLC